YRCKSMTVAAALQAVQHHVNESVRGNSSIHLHPFSSPKSRNIPRLAEEGNALAVKSCQENTKAQACYTDRRYLYCGTARSVSFSGSFLKFSLVTTMILSLPMNVVYASRFTSCGPNTRSYRLQTLLGQVSQWVSAPSGWKKPIFV